MNRVIVVGAGIVGASTAYHLARQGCSVVVVDPGVDGAATDASAGVISAVSTTPHPDSGYLMTAVAYCADLITQLTDMGLGDHGYRAAGEMIVATDEEERGRLAPLRAEAERLTARYGDRGTGVPEEIDADEARKLCPILGPVTGAVWLPAVAQVDGRRLRDCLLAAARAHGATVVHRRASLRTQGARVTGVTTPDGPIAGDLVVLAAGAWSTALVRDTGMSLPVRPQRGQIAHVRVPDLPEIPVASGFRSHYLLSPSAGRVAFGATREDDAGFEHALTPGGIAEMVAEATRMAPALAKARWLGGRIGFRAATPDGRPLVGTTDQVTNLLIGTGLGSIGLTLGPYAGAQLAHLALRQPAHVPAGFHPDRFMAGGAVPGR